MVCEKTCYYNFFELRRYCFVRKKRVSICTFSERYRRYFFEKNKNTRLDREKIKKKEG